MKNRSTNHATSSSNDNTSTDTPTPPDTPHTPTSTTSTSSSASSVSVSSSTSSSSRSSQSSKESKGVPITYDPPLIKLDKIIQLISAAINFARCFFKESDTLNKAIEAICKDLLAIQSAELLLPLLVKERDQEALTCNEREALNKSGVVVDKSGREKIVRMYFSEQKVLGTDLQKVLDPVNTPYERGYKEGLIQYTKHDKYQRSLEQFFEGIYGMVDIGASSFNSLLSKKEKADKNAKAQRKESGVSPMDQQLQNLAGGLLTQIKNLLTEKGKTTQAIGLLTHALAVMQVCSEIANAYNSAVLLNQQRDAIEKEVLEREITPLIVKFLEVQQELQEQLQKAKEEIQVLQQQQEQAQKEKEDAQTQLREAQEQQQKALEEAQKAKEEAQRAQQEQQQVVEELKEAQVTIQILTTAAAQQQEHKEEAKEEARGRRPLLSQTAVDEEKSQPSKEDYFKNNLQDLKKFIEATDFTTKWLGGKKIQISESSVKKVPTGIAEIYQKICHALQSGVEKENKEGLSGKLLGELKKIADPRCHSTFFRSKQTAEVYQAISAISILDRNRTNLISWKDFLKR